MIYFSCENSPLYFPWKVELAERQLHSTSKAHLLLQEGVLFVFLRAVRSEECVVRSGGGAQIIKHRNYNSLVTDDCQPPTVNRQPLTVNP